MDFHSIYEHGFARVAACTERITIADPQANAEAVLRQARACNEEGVAVALFPELCLTGYSIEDLLLQDAVLDAVEGALETIVAASADLQPVLAFGAPLRARGRVFNCAVVLHRGRVLGVAPKAYLPTYREFYERRGWPAERWLELGLELDNLVIGNHPGVTFGIHLCRGNQASRWLVSGGYEWLAAKIFPKVNAERLLLEYDDQRSGDFEPLREVPEDKTAVLGLVTTKSSRLETVDELSARIRDAARFVPLERLALSPQCGFATSVLGNALTVEDERAKLRRIAETAEAVWA